MTQGQSDRIGCQGLCQASALPQIRKIFTFEIDLFVFAREKVVGLTDAATRQMPEKSEHKYLAS